MGVVWLFSGTTHLNNSAFTAVKRDAKFKESLMIRNYKLVYGSYTNNHWVYIMYQHQNVSLWQTLGTSMGHAGV